MADPLNKTHKLSEEFVGWDFIHEYQFSTIVLKMPALFMYVLILIIQACLFTYHILFWVYFKWILKFSNLLVL